jgi:SDR family mycofactocin-dependent oxidoreductase
VARLAGKVAFITGAARGQGRAEAVRFAQEGASLILSDVAVEAVSDLPYALGTKAQLAETISLCESYGVEILADAVDTRDFDALQALAKAGFKRFRGMDIVVANAGIYSVGRLTVPDDATGIDVLSEQRWQDMIDVNVTGVYNTVRATTPLMVEAARGGAVVLTSSGLALSSAPNVGHYVTAKTAVTGLMRTLAQELGSHSIRVNTVNPGQVSTPMIHHDANYHLFRPDLESPTKADYSRASLALTVLPIPWVEASDVANAVLFLVSDEARYITGVTLPVDGGTAL